MYSTVLVTAQLTESDFKRYHSLEQEGRNRSSEVPPHTISKLKNNGDRQFLYNIAEAASELQRYFAAMGDEKWANFAAHVQSTASESRYAVNTCEISGLTRGECPMKTVQYELKRTDEAAKATGKTGIAIGGCSIHPKVLGDKYPNAYVEKDFLDDITSCFHWNLTEAEETARSWHKEGKCMWKE